MSLRVPPIGPAHIEAPPTAAALQRAVQAQAKVTGAAGNAALHSTLQTERDGATKARQDRLLGRRLAVQSAAAPAPTHTATGEDARSPAEPRDYLYRRRKRQGQGGGHKQGQDQGEGSQQR